MQERIIRLPGHPGPSGVRGEASICSGIIGLRTRAESGRPARFLGGTPRGLPIFGPIPQGRPFRGLPPRFGNGAPASKGVDAWLPAKSKAIPTLAVARVPLDLSPVRDWRVACGGRRALVPTRRRRLLLFVRLLAEAGWTAWTRRWHAGGILEPRPLAPPRAQQAEAQVVVAVAWRVVVAIRRPAVPGVVVPATAPIHPVRA